LFGWFKKDEAKSQSFDERFLSLSPEALGSAIERIIQEEIPATCAMYVVAYDNLRPLSAAARSAAAQNNNKPILIEDFIKILGDGIEKWKNDEIRSRRFSWLFMAANIARLDKLARNQESLKTSGAKCWIKLAESARHLKVLLPDNIVWSSNEKTWYDLLETERDFAWHVLSHTMPADYSSHPLILEFAKRQKTIPFFRDRDFFSIE
jgi:hypothetical protein